MTFQSPPSPEDGSPPEEAVAATSWRTPPAAVPSAIPDDQAQFSHAGLDALDPWQQTRPWHHSVWPWGMGGVVEALDVVILALVMFVGVRFVAHNYIVEGASMVPTFHDSDFVIVNRLAYRSFDLSWVPGVDDEAWQPFGAPQPGDVVVFHYQPSPTERDFIKRVIAIPGQTVHVTGGTVFVDGTPLDEPYIAQQPTYELQPTVVEPGTVFVLGDNRNNSFDSHSFGAVPVETVVGRADLRYWPLDRWGPVEHVLGGGQQVASRVIEGVVAVWR